MDDFRKSFEAAIDDFDVEKREVVAIISTDGVDREKDVLIPKGLRKKNYAGLTIDFNHDKNLPVAVSKWVKSEPNRVISKYRVSDKTEFACDVFNLLQDGVLRYHSVDGRAFATSKPTTDEKRLNKAWGDAERIVRDWELFNYTICTCAQNPDAVSLMVSKGYNPKTIEALTGKTIAEVQKIIVAPQPDNDARRLTGGEAFVALAKSLSIRTGSMSVESLISKAFDRARGKLD